METCTILLPLKRGKREPLGFLESASVLEKEPLLIFVLFFIGYVGLGLNALMLSIEVFSVCPRALILLVKIHGIRKLETLWVRHVFSEVMCFASFPYFSSFSTESLSTEVQWDQECHWSPPRHILHCRKGQSSGIQNHCRWRKFLKLWRKDLSKDSF